MINLKAHFILFTYFLRERRAALLHVQRAKQLSKYLVLYQSSFVEHYFWNLILQWESPITGQENFHKKQPNSKQAGSRQIKKHESLLRKHNILLDKWMI